MQPKNLKEAQEYKYSAWTGRPERYRFDPLRCAYEILAVPTVQFDQCLRRPGYGTDKIFCKQHAKMMEAGNE